MTSRNECVRIGKRRVSKLIDKLNALSKSKHGGSAVFEFAAGEPTEDRINPKDNTKDKRLEGGGIGIAVRCSCHGKKVNIHARCAFTIDGLSGATLTTETVKKREGEYGLLEGSLIMSVLMDNDENPIRFALYSFDDLVKWNCIEPRRDRSTFVRAHLDRVSERLAPFEGRKQAIGLIYQDDNLDAVAATMRYMRDDETNKAASSEQ